MDNNAINYNYGASWKESCNLTSVGTNGSSSYYGTYDQNGNVSELIISKNLDYTYSIGSIGGSFSSITENELFINNFSINRSSSIGCRLCCSNFIEDNNKWTIIKDINNTPDINGIGRVEYLYKISKYELTNEEYAYFLSIKKDFVDKYELFYSTTDDNQGIYKTLNGDYICKTGMKNKPVNYITLGNILRYINWKHNCIFNLENDADTETGVYLLNENLDPDINTLIIKPKKIADIPGVNNNELAYYWLPTEDEWYKSAYFNGSKYYEYATQSYELPCACSATEEGDGSYCNEYPSISPTPTSTIANTPTPTPTISMVKSNKTYNSANYQNSGLSKVGTNGGPSYYGTYDQNGNISELVYEKSTTSDATLILGGNFASASSDALLETKYTNIRSELVGFRICGKSTLNDYDMTLVSDINNISDKNNYGSVSYSYKITRFCITNNQYSIFLNAKNNVVDKYELFINADSIHQGIVKEYGGKYIVKANMGDLPVNFITIANALRYINWKENCLSTTADLADTETGVYLLEKIVNPDITSISRIGSSSYWLPTANEWYKAAYYARYNRYNKYATQYEYSPLRSTIDNTNTGSPAGSLPFPTPTPTPTCSPSVSSALVRRNIYEWGVADVEIIKQPTLIQKDNTYIGSEFNFDRIFTGSNFFMVSREDNILFPVKNNNSGQLGLNISKTDEYIDKLNTPISEVNSRWKRVSLGEEFTYIIDQYDNIYRWGSNRYDVLSSDLAKINIPYKLILDDGTAYFKSVSCGYDHVFIVTSDGRLMMCGSAHKQETKKFIQYMPGNNWKEVFTKDSFTFASKIEDDNLYLIGGILPDSDIYQQYITLNSVPLIVGKGMLDYNSLSVGDNHLLLVKSDGTLWSFGLNNNNQLGIEDCEYLNVLTQVGSKTNWSKVAAGKTHSLAINKLGVLYGWGNGKNYQFGLEGIEYLKIPTNIWTGNWLDISANGDLSGGISVDIQQMIVTQTPTNTPTPSTTNGPGPSPTCTTTITSSPTLTPSQTLIIPLFHVIIITTTPTPTPSQTIPYKETPLPPLILDPPYIFDPPVETIL